MKYKMKSDEVEILSKEFLPPEYYSELRCDLHPRYSTKFDQICIDTIVKGERVKIQGYLEDFALSKAEADELIMSARNIIYKD